MIFPSILKKVLRSKQLEVTFSYDLDGYEDSDFVIRPKIDRGLIKIYDPGTNSWISHSDVWTSMPTLQKEMKVQVELEGEAELFFEIQNTKDQKIYTTKEQKIWGGNLHGDYLEKLNSNINTFDLEESEPKSIESAPIQNDPRSFGLLAKVIKYIGEII